MEQSQTRWIYILLALCILAGAFFPKKVFADSKWLKHFRNDSLLNTYKTCYAMSDDAVWVGTNGDGILVYKADGTSKQFTNKNTRSNPSFNDGLKEDSITCLAIDEINGMVWIGTISGVARCNVEGKEWARYTYKEGLPNDVIRDIDVDSMGNVWVGTPSGVAMLVAGNEKFTTFAHEAATGSVHSIKVKNDAVWVGNVSGLIGCYKDGVWKTIMGY